MDRCQIQPVNEDIANSLGLDKPRGALVTEPQADGPALAAGIKSGDVITSVDGKDVASPRELARTSAATLPARLSSSAFGGTEKRRRSG